VLATRVDPVKNVRNASCARRWGERAIAAAACWSIGVAMAQSLPAPGVSAPAHLPQPSLAPPELPASPSVQPIPAAEWTADRIRQSFEQADANGDGLLTRAEAQRLTILPRTFEEMDENKDGLVSFSEYQRAFAR
jgi:hypothetical protein